MTGVHGGNGPIRPEKSQSQGAHTEITGSGVPMSQTGKWGFSTFADVLHVSIQCTIIDSAFSTLEKKEEKKRSDTTLLDVALC